MGRHPTPSPIEAIEHLGDPDLDHLGRRAIDLALTDPEPLTHVWFAIAAAVGDERDRRRQALLDAVAVQRSDQ